MCIRDRPEIAQTAERVRPAALADGLKREPPRVCALRGRAKAAAACTASRSACRCRRTASGW
eukprot:6181951-Alexandrium_andersonii.AAC.1